MKPSEGRMAPPPPPWSTPPPTLGNLTVAGATTAAAAAHAAALHPPRLQSKHMLMIGARGGLDPALQGLNRSVSLPHDIGDLIQSMNSGGFEAGMEIQLPAVAKLDSAVTAISAISRQSRADAAAGAAGDEPGGLVSSFSPAELPPPLMTTASDRSISYPNPSPAHVMVPSIARNEAPAFAATPTPAPVPAPTPAPAPAPFPPLAPVKVRMDPVEEEGADEGDAQTGTARRALSLDRGTSLSAFTSGDWGALLGGEIGSVTAVLEGDLSPTAAEGLMYIRGGGSGGSGGGSGAPGAPGAMGGGSVHYGKAVVNLRNNNNNGGTGVGGGYPMSPLGRGKHVSRSRIPITAAAVAPSPRYGLMATH